MEVEDVIRDLATIVMRDKDKARTEWLSTLRLARLSERYKMGMYLFRKNKTVAPVHFLRQNSLTSSAKVATYSLNNRAIEPG